MNYHLTDISNFKKVNNVLDSSTFIFIVKSKNQIERRERMLASRKRGKFGRIKEQKIDPGLFSICRIKDGELSNVICKEFKEPRHIAFVNDDEYLLSEMNTLTFINKKGDVLRRIQNPFFSFLHTIFLSSDKKRALVASSGYDFIFEINLSTEEITFEWFAWEHGFNPTTNGEWLAVKENFYEKYISEGKKAVFVDPAILGEKGVHTAYRTVHPNMAVYDPYDNEKSILISFGHQGEVYRINQATKEAIKVFSLGSQMPHGLMPYNRGWCITNTVKGEWWLMDKNFTLQEVYSVANLDHKVAGTEDVEWVQQAVPLGNRFIIFIDANRGIIAVDRAQRQYSIIHPDPNWCIQEIHYLDH